MPQRPDPTPFDPEIGAQSPVLEALVRGPAAALSAVLLVAGESAARSGFGAATAVAVADAWTAASRAPVLVDLCFENPELHHSLGTDNDEGIADAFAFGTSIDRLAQPAPGHGFSFLPAGLSLAPEEIRGAPEWRRLIAQEGAAGHTLLLYAMAGAPGLEALAQKVGAVILIAGEGDLPGAADSLARQFAIVAILQPVPAGDSADRPGRVPDSSIPAPDHRRPPLIVDDATEADRAEAGLSRLAAPADVPIAPAAVLDTVAESIGTSGGLTNTGVVGGFDDPLAGDRPTAEDFERVRVPREGSGREALIADLRARQRAALLAPGSDADLTQGVVVPAGARASEGAVRGATVAGRDRQMPAPTGTLPGEPPDLRRSRPPRRKHSLLWTLFVVLGLCLIVGALYVFGPPSFLNLRLRPAPVAPPQPTTAIPPVDSLTMVPLPFVVAVEAHQQLAAAEPRLETLNATAGAHFFIAPLVREDLTFYHIFAGPMKDSATAAVALDSLLARGIKTGTTPGDLRQMPLSFLVGEYETEQEALEQVRTLRATGIPTYIVRGGMNGAERWRVYAGAYSGPAESDVMRQLLRGAGIKDSLVTRMGRANQ